MPDLKDLQTFFDDDALKLPPIKSKKHPNGKRYVVQSPDFETGMLLQQLANLGAKAAAGVELTEADAKKLNLDDDEEREFAAMLLGETLNEMRADGVSWASIQKVVKYAFAYYAMSPEAAEQIAAPKAPENRAARRKKGSTTAK